MQTQMIENTVNKLYKLPPVQLESAVRYIDELFKVSVEHDKQEMLNQLMGSMQGVEIDDPKQAYHDHLDEKYAEYFTDSKTNDFTAYLADWRERNKDILTDDDPWADVRDKEISKGERQARFLAWRKEYEKMMAELDDGWTDDDHNAIWDNVRDKNDFGREVTFDE